MLETWILVVSVFVGLAGGTLIGAVGVGGIIIVPILVELPGIKIYKAIAVCPDPVRACPRCAIPPPAPLAIGGPGCQFKPGARDLTSPWPVVGGGARANVGCRAGSNV